jgi:D-Tyr-tRNAtyr deacylase
VNTRLAPRLSFGAHESHAPLIDLSIIARLDQGCQSALSRLVDTAKMEVELVNDGPVTIVLDV